MLQVAIALLLFAPCGEAFLFPFAGGSGGGCSCQQNLCAPPPICPSPAPCPRPCQPIYTQDCCASCLRPCRFRLTKRRHKRDGILEDPLVTVTNAKCNSERLRTVMSQNPYKGPSQAKRFIQDSAERQFGTKFNVICARGDFSYITNTEEYCQETIRDLTCYAFKHFSRPILLL